MKNLMKRGWWVWCVTFGGIPLLTYCSSDSGSGDSGAGGTGVGAGATNGGSAVHSGGVASGGSTAIAGSHAGGNTGTSGASGSSGSSGEAGAGGEDNVGGTASGGSAGGGASGVGGAGGAASGSAGVAGVAGSGGAAGGNAGTGGNAASSGGAGSGGVSGGAGSGGVSGGAGSGGVSGGNAGLGGNAGGGGAAGSNPIADLGALHLSTNELDFSYTCAIDESFPDPITLGMTVSNTGSTSLTWSVTSDGAAVSPSTSTLARGDHVDLTVTPKALGDYNLSDHVTGGSSTPFSAQIGNLNFSSSTQSGFISTSVIAKIVGDILHLPDIDFGTVTVAGSPYVRETGSPYDLYAPLPFVTYVPPNGSSPVVSFEPMNPGTYEATVSFRPPFCVFVPNTFEVKGVAQ